MSWDTLIEQRLAAYRDMGRYRSLESDPLPVDSIPVPPLVRNFSHNDYLGLSTHPKLLALAGESIRGTPGGSAGSRLLGGNRALIEETEEDIAKFFHAPAALLFSSGYLANVGIVSALSELADTLYCDERLHASLIDGARLGTGPGTRSGSRSKVVVPHSDWDSVSAETEQRKSLIVAESLYSMDGDLVPTSTLLAARERTDGFLLLDEAHAAGVFDDTGRGLSAEWRDFSSTAVVVTFGKAFGVAGAAVLCSRSVREWLVNSARSFIFSTAPSPWVARLIQASLVVMREEGASRRAELWSRAKSVRSAFVSAGILKKGPFDDEKLSSYSPIIPVPLQGNDRALRFAALMREFGWTVKAIRYPTVPLGSERIRISLNLQVSRQETEGFTQQVVEQWKAFS